MLRRAAPSQSKSSLEQGSNVSLRGGSSTVSPFRRIAITGRKRYRPKKSKRIAPEQTISRGQVDHFLLEATTRQYSLESESGTDAHFYTRHILDRVAVIPILASCLRNTNLSDLLRLLGLCAATLREKQDCSAIDLIRDAIQKELLRAECDNAEHPAYHYAQEIIYCIVGRLTMLYDTQVVPPGKTGCISVTNLENDTSIVLEAQDYQERPVFEILNYFNNLLDPQVILDTQDRIDAASGQLNTVSGQGHSIVAGALLVSCLNASTLCGLGGLHIVWVKTMARHLWFDPHRRNIYLFCMPSFFAVGEQRDFILVRAFDEYFQARDRPNYFTVQQFLKEIRASYRLLFVDDARSRRQWRDTELERATEACGGMCDPALESILTTTPDQGLRTTYSAEVDFPIFRRRLQALQDDILTQHPNDLSALWHDRRDLLRWAQFWLVLIVAGIGLLLSLIQTVFTIVQSVYAIRGGGSGGGG